MRGVGTLPALDGTGNTNAHCENDCNKFWVALMKHMEGQSEVDRFEKDNLF
jgi:hypothetical protein